MIFTYTNTQITYIPIVVGNQAYVRETMLGKCRITEISVYIQLGLTRLSEESVGLLIFQCIFS